MSRFALLVIAAAMCVTCNAQSEDPLVFAAANSSASPEVASPVAAVASSPEAPPPVVVSSAAPDDAMQNDAPAASAEPQPNAEPSPSPEVPAVITDAAPIKPVEVASDVPPTREPPKSTTFANLVHNNTEPEAAATTNNTETPNKNSGNNLKTTYGCVLFTLAAIYYQSY